MRVLEQQGAGFWQAMKPCRFRIAPSKAAILRARLPPISNN